MLELVYTEKDIHSLEFKVAERIESLQVRNLRQISNDEAH